MTDWQMFKVSFLPLLWKPMLPTIYRNTEKPQWWDARAPGAVAIFTDDNAITLLPDAGRAVLLHEYGHWMIWRVRRWFDGLWEVPWWALGIRRLFIGRRS